MATFARLGLRINVFARAVGTAIATLPITGLAARIESYEHTVTDKFGFESMTCTLTVTLEEALDYLTDGLLRSCVVAGPDGEIVWEGYLNAIEATIGQKRATVSLDGMANRVRVRYTDYLDNPDVTASVSDAPSIALYGTKDAVLSISKSTGTAALNLATRALAEMKNPRASTPSAAATGALGTISLTLHWAGWYGALDWLLTSNTSTTSTSTTTQVGALLTTISATNFFILTTTDYIEASGISDVEMIAQDTSYRNKIEALLSQGTSQGLPLTWGVYEERRFYVEAWRGSGLFPVDYYERVDSAEIFDSGGGVVAPWNVRPNRKAQVIELIDVAPDTSTQDAAARKYVSRVRCYISGDSIGCDLEPSASGALDAQLARLTR